MIQEYALYGIRIEFSQHRLAGPFKKLEVRELVARFSSELMAKAYVKASCLAKPIRQSISLPFRRKSPFRQKSLLSPYSYAEIEEYCPEVLPILDPPL